MVTWLGQSSHGVGVACYVIVTSFKMLSRVRACQVLTRQEPSRVLRAVPSCRSQYRTVFALQGAWDRKGLANTVSACHVPFKGAWGCHGRNWNAKARIVSLSSKGAWGWLDLLG